MFEITLWGNSSFDDSPPFASFITLSETFSYFQQFLLKNVSHRCKISLICIELFPSCSLPYSLAVLFNVDSLIKVYLSSQLSVFIILVFIRSPVWLFFHYIHNYFLWYWVFSIIVYLCMLLPFCLYNFFCKISIVHVHLPTWQCCMLYNIIQVFRFISSLILILSDLPSHLHISFSDNIICSSILVIF